MALKLAVNQSLLMQCQTDEFISLCANAGINAVELRVPLLKEALCHMSYKELTNLLKKHGVSVLALNSIDDFSMVPEENLDLLKMECELVGRLCEMMECPLVMAPVARWFGLPPSREEIITVSQERLRYVAEILQPFGVQIGFEPICFPEFTVRDLELSQTIIAKSGVKGIAIVPDIYNLFRGGIQPKELTTLKYPIALMHINDAEDRPLEDLHVMYNRTFPGEGVADAKTWVQTLLKDGYQGYFSLEIFRKDLWEMPPQDVMSLSVAKLQTFARSLEN